MNPWFRSAAWVFVAVVLQSVFCYGGSPIEDLPFEERGKIFMAEREQDRALLDGVHQSEDVARLERLAGSLEEAKKEIPPSALGTPRELRVKDLRMAALIRLGELETEESLAAVERIEKKLKDRDLVPDVVSLELETSPVFHFQDSEMRPLATIEAPDGMTYGVIQHPFLMGGEDFFLISSKTPNDKASWSRPKLIPTEALDSQYLGGKVLLVAKGEGVLELSVSPRTPPVLNLPPGGNNPAPVAPSEPWKMEMTIQDILKDQDGDGWTDNEELRLKLDPQKKDTDGDGLEDGKDTCPNFAPPPEHENDEEIQIVQRAFFAAFGLTESRFLLLVRPPSTKTQVFGYTGPVIYLQEDQVEQWRNQHQRGGMFVTWTVAIIPERNEARVRISDYESSMAGSSQEIILHKIDGKWIVVQHVRGGVA